MRSPRAPRAEFRAILLLLLSAAGAVAQEQPGDDLAPVERQAEVLNGLVVMGDRNFDQWVFRGSPESARRRIHAHLRSKIGAAAQAGQLSEAQQQKLELAGRGDIRRFDERVAALRARSKNGRLDPDGMQELFKEVQPLQAAVHGGLFGQGSLYAKTLRRILTSDQAADYARHDRERRQFRYEARVEAAVTNLDGGLALRNEQRAALIALLLKHSAPPRQFSQFDQYYVIFQLTQIPDGKLNEILDPDQRRMLQRVFDQYQGIEPLLRQHGMIPEPADEAEAGRGDAAAEAILRE